jgi:ketosteroid isomerase-like protein
MSQENVVIVQRAYEALNQPDLDRAKAIGVGLYHRDVVLDTTTAAFDGAVHHGVDGLREESSARRGMWKSQRFEPLDFIAVDEAQVVVPMRIVSVGRDGIETVAHAAMLWTIREGRIAHLKTFQSKADALEAAGLHE